MSRRKTKTSREKGTATPKTASEATPLVNKYLTEIRLKIENKQKEKDARHGQEDSDWELEQYAYRGQAGSSWGLKSTVFRRHGGDLLPEAFIKYNCNLVDEAKDANYHWKESKKLEDIEMLAELRHYNAATALIDFTRDCLVALWFACASTSCASASEEEEAGKVFIVQTSDTNKFLQLELKDKGKTLEKILRFETREKTENSEGVKFRSERRLWYWEPRFEINHRLSSQKGVFIFGKPVLSDNDIEYAEVDIPSKCKGALRLELRVFFGISEASLFNDLPGFAVTNDANHEISIKTMAEYLKTGREYSQQGKPKKAIGAYDKIIERYEEPPV